jgi:HAD superfamily hydrolase (TIGR01509 family)
LTLQELKQQNKGTLDEMIVHFFGTGLSADKIHDLGQEKERIYRELYQGKVEGVKGLNDFLSALKAAKYPVALATMGDQPNIDFILGALALGDAFDFCIGGHQVSKGKPDPMIFEKVVKALQVAPEACLIFEDSGAGIQAAKAAGARVCGVASAYSTDKLLEQGCDLAISDYSDKELWNALDLSI